MINDLIVLVIGAAVGAAVASMIAWGIVRVSKTDMERIQGRYAQLHGRHQETWVELKRCQAAYDQLLVEQRQGRRPLPPDQKRELAQLRHDIDVLMFKALEDDTLPRIEPIPENL